MSITISLAYPCAYTTRIIQSSQDTIFDNTLSWKHLLWVYFCLNTIQRCFRTSTAEHINYPRDGSSINAPVFQLWHYRAGARVVKSSFEIHEHSQGHFLISNCLVDPVNQCVKCCLTRFTSLIGMLIDSPRALFWSKTVFIVLRRKDIRLKIKLCHMWESWFWNKHNLWSFHNVRMIAVARLDLKRRKSHRFR